MSDQEAGSAPWWRRRTPTWLALPLWLIIAPLAALAFCRIFAWDSIALLAILNAVTIILYLPAWPIAVAAVWGRRPVLAAVAFVVVVAQVFFLAPELAASESPPSWTAGAPAFRLFDANVYSENSSMAGYASQIRTLKPDVVAMEETNPTDVTQLRSSGALAGLPHQFEVSGYSPFVFFIASRFPLRGTHVIDLYGRPLIVETTVQLPAGPQVLWVVHTIAPLPPSFDQWTGQLARIRQLIQLHRPAGLLVAGDFNATWNSKGFRSVLDTGMTDAGAARGHALEMTWSQLMAPLPPFARIDHILTGSGVAVTDYATQVGVGSDHRDLIATVAVRRR
jgi:endonuclease/exonuclease/phosphatase (EEP) superfamily protein YafD